MEHWQSRAAIGVGLGLIAGYEAIAPKDELISDETERIRSGKIGNAVAQALIWTTAFHLSGGFKRFGLENIDPLHQVTTLKRRAIGK